MKLSPAQTNRHWRDWQRVLKSLGGAHAPSRASEGDPPELGHSQWHTQVRELAASLAAQCSRAVTADDLRRACYWVALGAPKSLTQFSNADFDRVLALFAALIDPDDINATTKVLQFQKFDSAIRQGVDKRDLPEEPGRRRRYLNFLNTVPTHYLNSIQRDKAGPFQERGSHMAWWESLPIAELHELVMTLKNRKWQPAAAPQPDAQLVDCPF